VYDLSDVIIYMHICYFIFSAHPFCLCMAMIVWFVRREHMWIQVMLRMLRQRS